MKPVLALILVFFFLPATLFSQQKFQSIRGVVTDKISGHPLPGANVVIEEPTGFTGTATDEKGRFSLENIPVGRVSLKITFLGFSPFYVQNLMLTSAKEVVLSIALEEAADQLKEITIAGSLSKERPVNETAIVSARSVSIEESQRYAGSFNDPARMVAAFAGVAGGTDERNDIIIRGNSPLGLLWRMEGINIPNPNHFAFTGASGGAVSMLNNNQLATSDFFTGAFPAGYGNALSGVFDLRLRAGNNRKREYVGQLGINGFEFGLEGPFSKNHNASYLAGYRYSAIGLLELMGLNLGVGAIPYFQDAFFMIAVPGKKDRGQFRIFGMGGLSSIQVKYDPDSSVLRFNEEREKVASDMGLAGISHVWFPSQGSSWKTTIGFSGASRTNSQEAVFDNGLKQALNRDQNRQVTLNGHTVFSQKLKAGNFLRTGLIADIWWFNLNREANFDPQQDPVVLNQSSGRTGLLQAYFLHQKHLTGRLSLNSGLNGQVFLLNGNYSMEPRLGAKWFLSEKHSLNYGMGLHSQIQPLPVYFLETILSNGEAYLSNKGLSMSRSFHQVLGYDFGPGDNLRFKSELYYQYLFRIPVSPSDSVYSLVNAGEYIGLLALSDSLENTGTGYNYGIELTAEKFFSRQYYFLATASLFQSKYKGSDGKLRNTAFNGNFNLTLLGGYEFRPGKKKNNSFRIDGRTSLVGGQRIVPIDEQSSVAQGKEVKDYARAYQERRKHYFRADLKFTYRINLNKTAQMVSVDIQNVFNTQNTFYEYWDVVRERITIVNQLGVLPTLFYRIEF